MKQNSETKYITYHNMFWLFMMGNVLALLPIFLPVLLYLPSILSYKTVRVYSIICRESNAWNFRPRFPTRSA